MDEPPVRCVKANGFVAASLAGSLKAQSFLLVQLGTPGGAKLAVHPYPIDSLVFN